MGFSLLDGYAVRKIERIFCDIRAGNTRSAITELQTSMLAKHFSSALIDGICQGLETGEWGQLRELYLDRAFISPEGLILWIAPYRQLRNGKRTQTITGIFGVAPIEESYDEIRRVAHSLFGANFHPVSQIVGFRRIASFGMAGGPTGEAFLVPNGWTVGDTSSGPALNDMTEQYARLRASEGAVRSILDDNAANMVLQPVLDTVLGAATQNLEFQYHEVAHGIGLGFSEKIRLGIFRSFHNCAVEEWRSDGISFSLMSELLEDDARGRLVAANLALRLSVDALRAGGLDSDHDAHATALTLQDLLDSGAAAIVDGRLSLNVASYAELADTVDRQRTRAWQVTLGEIACRGDIDRLGELYAGVALREDIAGQLRTLIVS